MSRRGMLIWQALSKTPGSDLEFCYKVVEENDEYWWCPLCCRRVDYNHRTKPEHLARQQNHRWELQHDQMQLEALGVQVPLQALGDDDVPLAIEDVPVAQPVGQAGSDDGEEE